MRASAPSAKNKLSPYNIILMDFKDFDFGDKYTIHAILKSYVTFKSSTNPNIYHFLGAKTHVRKKMGWNKS